MNAIEEAELILAKKADKDAQAALSLAIEKQREFVAEKEKYDAEVVEQLAKASDFEKAAIALFHSAMKSTLEAMENYTNEQVAELLEKARDARIKLRQLEK